MTVPLPLAEAWPDELAEALPRKPEALWPDTLDTLEVKAVTPREGMTGIAVKVMLPIVVLLAPIWAAAMALPLPHVEKLMPTDELELLLIATGETAAAVCW